MRKDHLATRKTVSFPLPLFSLLHRHQPHHSISIVFPPSLSPLTFYFCLVSTVSRLWKYLSRKFELVASSASEHFVFKIPRQFHRWIVNDFLVTDFFSHDACEIDLAYFWYQEKLTPVISVKNISKITGSPSSKYEHRRASALLRNIQNVRICMGKKTIVSVTYENERTSIKNSLPYLKCVLRLSCVVHGPIMVVLWVFM